MYEVTYETILNRMLERVPSSIDKREGSVIYDALAPAAAELTQMYIALNVILNETYADTASRAYLILRASERGIIPYPATCAVAKGIFNCDVPIGSRFNIDRYNYAVTEALNDTNHSYRMTCEMAGADPNHYLGTLSPIEYIDGLTAAELVEILIPGEDEETTEALRQRYFNSFDDQAFGGNRKDYIQKVNAIPGVGGVKVCRAWNGGGTVKLIIIDSDYKEPTTTLVNTVQTVVDPTQNSGEGYGIAPLDHVVTVVGATTEVVNIVTTITYADGWDFSEAKPYIEATLDDYFTELNSTWQNSDNLIVRVSQIESRLLDLDAVLDVENTIINGAAANYTVSAVKIVSRGTVNGNQ